MEHLAEHGGDHADQQGRDQHQADGQGLGRHEGPVGHRGGVDDLMGLALALTPDQLARIVDGDDHRDQAERTQQGRQQDAGDRIDHPAITPGLGGEPQGAHGVRQAQEKQDEIGRALEHLTHVQACADDQLRPGRLAIEHRPRHRAGQRRRDGGLFGQGLLVLLGLASAGQLCRLELEQAVGQGQEAGGQDQYEDAVEQQGSGQRRHKAVAFAGGPVLGRQAEGGGAQRLPIGGGLLELGPVQGDAGDDPQHHEGDHAHIGPHHRTGDRGQGEEDRRGQQDRRQGQGEIGEEVGVQIVRPEALGVDPRHERADPDRQRHGQERDRRRQERPDEAAVEIVELLHPRGPQDRPKAGLVVTHHHIGHEGRGHEHVEDRQDQMGLGDRVRCVAVDVAAAADLDLVDRRRPEGQQEEDGRHHPEDGRLQLVAELEARDLAKHRLAPS